MGTDETIRQVTSKLCHGGYDQRRTGGYGMVRRVLGTWKRGQFCPPRTISQHLDTFLVVETGGAGCCLHPAGQGQRCCQTPYNAHPTRDSNSLLLRIIPQRIIHPEMSVAPRLRNSGLALGQGMLWGRSAVRFEKWRMLEVQRLRKRSPGSNQSLK